MRFFAVSPEMQQRVAVVVPIIALLISLFLVYPAWGRNSTLTKQVSDQQSELKKLKSVPLPQPGPVAPAVDALPSEPADFLGQIRILAASAHCQLSGYGANVKMDAKSDDKVQPVRARVELTARYQDIRNFLYQLSQAPRVYVVTDLSLERPLAAGAQSIPEGRVRAQIEIERFVIPVKKP